jgi:hypothetical protein
MSVSAVRSEGRSTTVRRTGILALLAASVALTGLLAAPAPAPAQTTTLLPDLGMAQLADIRAARVNGRKAVRYTTIITNTGVGRFEVFGQRSSTSQTEMAVTQRIFDSAGGSTTQATAARLFFAGDGHSHWHVRDLESSELIRLDNGNKVGTGTKHGFCFFDNYDYRLGLPGSPQSPVYTDCGHSTDLTVTMGLSVGWGDMYHYTLPDQYIDVQGLPAGRYRLQVTADAQNWFAESDDTNNTTWVNLQLKGGGAIKILSYGPSS